MVGTNIWIQLLNVLSFSMDYELQILQSSLVDHISYITVQRRLQLIHSFLILVSWNSTFYWTLSPVLNRTGGLLHEFSKWFPIMQEDLSAFLTSFSQVCLGLHDQPPVEWNDCGRNTNALGYQWRGHCLSFWITTERSAWEVTAQKLRDCCQHWLQIYEPSVIQDVMLTEKGDVLLVSNKSEQCIRFRCTSS